MLQVKNHGEAKIAKNKEFDSLRSIIDPRPEYVGPAHAHILVGARWF